MYFAKSFIPAAMNIRTYCLLLFLIFYPLTTGISQTGFSMPPGVRQMDIPFDYVNNFIIVSVVINNTFTLKMIFDTGAEHTILSKRYISDILKVPYEREFRLMGADLKTELVAYLARNINLKTPNVSFTAPEEDILVLQEDYFRFEEYAGVNVHGILAAKSFAKYIFKINYQRRVITLFDREWFKLPDSGFRQMPVEIFHNKIYLNTKVAFRSGTTTSVKLLLDTGAALPLLFFSNTDSLVHPPKNAIVSNIGMGLGGYLEGFIGRTEGLEIGGFQQKGIVTYFQELDTAHNHRYLNNRNGLIGNMMLNRFQIIIDYHSAHIWLKPTKKFKQKYVFDRSGLTVVAGGENFNQFTVQAVIPNSPASEVGILPGDRITRLGITPASFLGLKDILHYFQKKPGKKVRVVIRRNGKRLKKKFRLRDLI